MYYRKVRNNGVYIEGKLYLYPREYLRRQHAMSQGYIKEVYDYLASKKRVSIRRTWYDYRVEIIGDEKFPNRKYEDRVIFYWYDESYYYTHYLCIV